MNKEDIKKLLDKVVNYRGVVINDFISIEAMIGAIIAIYFAKEDKNNEFNRKVIDDEYFSFGLKINIIEKLNFDVYKEFIEDIRRINKIRNIFAHSVPTLDGGLSYYNKNKGEREFRKLEELHDEFLKKLLPVDEQLKKIFSKLVEENRRRNKDDGS